MTVARRIARYGWQRDAPDPRDLVYNNEARILAASAVPRTSDLSGEMPPIYNQLGLGSCTANATAAIFQHQQMRQGEAEGSEVPSRLFVYYEERRIEGQPLDQDTGAQVRDGIKVLVSAGAPPEASWPYSDANPGPFQEKPPDDVYALARRYEATRYMRLVVPGPGAPMRTALSHGFPIAFGFSVPALFEDPSWDPSSQYLPLPDARTEFIGGHATVVVGHDFTRSRFDAPVFKIRNSWGPKFGESGHFWIHSEWFQQGLATDLWVVERAS